MPCPWAVPRAAPSRPPASARRPAPRWALPDLHPGRGLHTSAASLSPEDWSPSAVVFQMAVVSLHPPGRKEMRAGRGLVFFLFCWQDLSSLTRDRTQACCTRSAESFLGNGPGDGPRPVLSSRAFQGRVRASLSVSAAGRLQNRPPTQGWSAGQLPTALHVLLGPNVENLGGRQLGALGPAGKAAREELASEAADQGGRSQWKRREGAQGRDGAEGLEAGQGRVPLNSGHQRRAEGLGSGTAVPRRPAPCQPWLLPFFPVPPGCHCSKTGLGSRLPRPCLESAGTQGARLGPGPGSHPIGLL